nr:SDR family NAD(P)-dependent oxidoreductase [Nitratireductor aquimarinus]
MSLPVIADLAGARVLITGAGGGIGAGIAEAFARCGATVGIHYNSNADGAASVKAAVEAAGGRGLVLQADLTTRGGSGELVQRFAQAASGLDVLVNNAGGPEFLKPVADLGDEDFDRIFDLNARCVFEACRGAVPYLKASVLPGCIINVTSLSARVGSGPGASIYGASKAFVGAFSKTLARELAADKVRVNALSPGFIATPLHDKVSSADLVSNWVKQIPMGRGGAAIDCAGTALYLASPTLSGFVTGQVMEVNGGQFMGG